jgi:hypothetical protein
MGGKFALGASRDNAAISKDTDVIAQAKSILRRAKYK